MQPVRRGSAELRTNSASPIRKHLDLRCSAYPSLYLRCGDVGIYVVASEQRMDCMKLIEEVFQVNLCSISRCLSLALAVICNVNSQLHHRVAVRLGRKQLRSYAPFPSAMLILHRSAEIPGGHCGIQPRIRSKATV